MAGITDEKPHTDPSQADYERKFNDGVQDAETRGTYNGDSQSADTDAARERETTPDGSPRGSWSTNVNNPSRAERKAGLFFTVAKKRGPLAAILFILGLGGVGIGGLTAGLGPIMFVETALDDLNDQLAAMDVAGTNLFKNKIPSKDKSAAIKGCGVISIRCKFATLSNKQVAKLERAGIAIEVERTFKTPFGERVIPSGYRFQGVLYNPEGWAEQLRTNRAAIAAQKKANRLKYAGFSDKTFLGHTLARFGITKKPAELSGNKQERINALLNKAGTPRLDNISFRNPAEVQDASGKPITEFIDTKGRTVKLSDIDAGDYRVLAGDTSSKPTLYTAQEALNLRETITEGKARVGKPPSKITTASIGALSALGIADLSCSIVHMIGAASIAAKVANQAETIQYAMGVASHVQKIKAGDSTPEDAEAIGDFFTATDSRRYLPDIEGSLNDDGSVKEEIDATKVNPNYGKSALDSNLIKMSINGGVAPASESQQQLSLGVGQNQLLSSVDMVADIADTILNVGSDGVVCDVIQSAGVRILGIVAAVAIAIGSGGSGLGVQIAIGAALIGAMVLISTLLNAALDGSVIESADLKSNTVARGDVVWTGLAGVSSVAAQNRGLVPANSEEIVAYGSVRNEVKQEYIALEREDADPFDVYNQYSFAGSLARSVLKYTPTTTTSAASVTSSLVSFIGQGLLSPLSQKTSAASGVKDPERFKRCDDNAYQELGIEPDIQCNVRFFMPESALALDPDEVAAWMEGRYVEEDSITGFPRGYTPPEPKQSQDAVLDFVNGITEGFVDQFVNIRSTMGDYNDYAKFLDYCVYRTLPFGDVFEDNHGVGAVSKDWLTGKMCRSTEKKFDYFRMYTLYKSINEGFDDEGVDDFAQTTDKQALAQRIVAKNKVTYLGNVRPKLEEIANGSVDPNSVPCGINLHILQIIDKITDSYSIKISDINRNCSKNTLYDEGSRHYAGNGSGLDIAVINGRITNGRDPNALALIRIAMPTLKEAANSVNSFAQIGQVNCGSNPSVPAGIRLIKDSCNHLHMDVPAWSDKSLKYTPGGW